MILEYYTREQIKRIRWSGNVACMGERIIRMGLWCRNLMKRTHLEDLGVDGRVVLEHTSKKIGWEAVDWSDLAQGGQLLGFCE